MMKFKTWHFESAFVALVLVAVNYITGAHWYEWIGALAVWFTFGHASVSFRMEEAQAIREAESGKSDVECYRWLTRYFLAKEATWFVYFTILHAYSALVGVFVFLVYPYWRRFWVNRRIALERIKHGDRTQNKA